MKREQHLIGAHRRLSEVEAVDGDLSYLVEGVKRSVRKQIRDQGLVQNEGVRVEIIVSASTLASD